MNRRDKLVLTALVLAAGAPNLNMAVTGVALPAIGKELHANQVDLDLIAVAFPAGLAAAVLYLAAVGDRFGHRITIIVGSLACVPVSIMAAMAETTPWLVVARALTGVTAAAVYPASLAGIMGWWAHTKPGRGRAVAIWSGAGAAVMAGGPVVAGWAVSAGHLEWVYLSGGVLSAVAAVVVAFCGPGPQRDRNEVLDHTGGLTVAAAIVGAVVAINFAGDRSEWWWAGVFAAAAGTAAALFVRHCHKAGPKAVFDFKVGASKLFWVPGIAGAVVAGNLSAVILVGLEQSQDVNGWTALAAGAVVLPAAVAAAATAPIGAHLEARRGTRDAMLVGLAVTGAGLVVAAASWQPATRWWALGAGYALAGAGMGLCGGPAAHAMCRVAPSTRAGMAAATVDAQRIFGGAISQSLAGTIIAVTYASAMGFAGRQAASGITWALRDDPAVAGTAREAFSAAARLAGLSGLAVVGATVALVALAMPAKSEERWPDDRPAEAGGTGERTCPGG